MRCGACGTEIPKDLVGTFPCPSCGVELLRTHGDEPASVVGPPRSRWMGWVILPGVCIAMVFGTWLAFYAWERDRSELGWAFMVVLPLCIGALCGYVSRTFVRVAGGIAGIVVLLFGIGYLARIAGLV